MTIVVVGLLAVIGACLAEIAWEAWTSPLLDDQWPTFTPTDVVDARELVPTYLETTVQEMATAAAQVRGWAS